MQTGSGIAAAKTERQVEHGGELRSDRHASPEAIPRQAATTPTAGRTVFSLASKQKSAAILDDVHRE